MSGATAAPHRLDGGKSHAVRTSLEPLLQEVRTQLGGDIALALYQSFSSEYDLCLLAGSTDDARTLPLPNEPLHPSHGLTAKRPMAVDDLVLTSTVRRFRLELAAALVVPWRDASGRGWLILGLDPRSWNRGTLDLTTAQDFVPQLREAHLLAGFEGTVKLHGDLDQAIRFVSEVNLETEDVSSVLEAVVVAVRELLGTSVAYISLPEDDPDYFQFSTLLNIKTSAFRRLRVRLGEGLGGFTREQMRTIRSLNYAEDRRLRHAPVKETLREGILSAMCTPLVIDSRVIGLLYVGNRELTPFTETDVALIEEFAGYATLGIRHAQVELHRQAVMRRREQERLASRLHDSVVRSLVEIGFQAEQGMVIPGDAGLRHRFSIISRAAEHCLESLRTQLAELATGGSTATVTAKDVADRIQSTHWHDRVTMTVRVNAPPHLGIPREVARALTQIGQEALENSQLHSGGQSISLELDASAESVRMAVSDDGLGIQASELDQALADDPRHLGLRSMRATTKRLGGRLSLRQGAAGGLMVEAEIPLHQGLRGTS